MKGQYSISERLHNKLTISWENKDICSLISSRNSCIKKISITKSTGSEIFVKEGTTLILQLSPSAGKRAIDFYQKNPIAFIDPTTLLIVREL